LMDDNILYRPSKEPKGRGRFSGFLAEVPAIAF
jgi:hypothetical protein